jgi:hypothetical protein
MEFGVILQPRTWILDLDGTLVKHNGYRNDSGDEVLEGVIEFFDNFVSEDDYVLIVTARLAKYKEDTIKFLDENKIRFNQIIFDMPPGLRILINDKKPDGTETALSFNMDRDQGMRTFNADLYRKIE